MYQLAEGFRPAPSSPKRGMAIWVQDAGWGDYKASVGTEHVVTVVNREYFEVASTVRGRRARNSVTKSRPIAGWSNWLRLLSSKGRVFIDGIPSVPPPPVLDSNCHMLDIRSRELRMGKARSEVLSGYRLTFVGSDGEAMLFLVDGGDEHKYEVRISPTWSSPPKCTCPDAVYRLPAQAGKSGAEGRAVHCKHVMAVLMSRDELRGQLLDLFI